MVKIRGPAYSMTAQGWLGRSFYAKHGIVPIPYPVGLLPKHLTHSVYYSIKGWCYQRRRTWHGVIWSAMRPPISVQPNTAIQYAYKQVFAEGVHTWQGMNQATKDVYNKWRYPVKASGYNRFLRWYLKENLAFEMEDKYIATKIVAADGSGDYTDIQSALDALPAGGGLVFVKEGTYTLTSTITIAKSNVTLAGQGDATIIKIGDGADINAITLGDGVDPYSNIVIRDLKIDGNEDNQASNGIGIKILGQVSRVVIDGCHVVETRDFSVDSDQDSSYLTIINCLFDSDAGGVNVNYCHNFVFAFNVIATASHIGVWLYNSNNFLLLGNYIKNPGTVGFSSANIFCSGCSRGQIIGNVVLEHYYNDIWLNGCSRVVISDNEIGGDNEIGINIYESTDCRVIGNYGTTLNQGISVMSSPRCIIIGNEFEASQWGAINIWGSTDCIVKGNFLKDNSVATDNTYDGVRLDGTCLRCVISGNVIYEVAANKAKYGINENNAACNYNLIQGNIIRGWQTASVRVQGANSLVDTNII